MVSFFSDSIFQFHYHHQLQQSQSKVLFARESGQYNAATSKAWFGSKSVGKQITMETSEDLERVIRAPLSFVQRIFEEYDSSRSDHDESSDLDWGIPGKLSEIIGNNWKWVSGDSDHQQAV